MTIPEGITIIPRAAFRNVPGLKNVHLPSTLTEIGEYAFAGCTALKYIEPVDGLLSVGSYAFSNCTSLETLYLPETITSFGEQVFQNCSALTVECKEYSHATVYCIDNGVPMLFIGSSEENSEVMCLDREQSYYVANTVGALANGYVTMNLAYGFKSAVQSSISDMQLILRIPNDLTLMEKTLTLDGATITDYNYEETTLTIPVQNASGRVAFCLKPIGDCMVTTYALMNFKESGTVKEEVVGIINEKIPLLTILADDTVNTNSVRVSGIGPGNSDVSIYINGALATTVRTSKAGGYSANVTLTEPANYKVYNIVAKATVDGEAITATRAVQYNVSAPVLQSFIMKYQNQVYNIKDLGNTKPVVTFTGGTFQFNVKFSNPEQIKTVYVCSSRSNVVKRLEAVWNEEEQCFVAKGMFDPDNANYVPGTITVQYTPVRETLDFSKDIDYTSEQYVNNLPEQFKAVIDGGASNFVTIKSNTSTKLSGTLDLPTAESTIDFDYTTSSVPSYLTKGNAASYGYVALTDDLGEQMFLKITTSDFVQDQISGQIVDFTEDKVVDFLFEGKYYEAEHLAGTVFAYADVFSTVNDLIKWDNRRVSLDEAERAIHASSMSASEKATALQKLENAKKANYGTLAAMALPAILAAAGIAIPFPASMILPLIALQNEMYAEDILSQFGFLDAKESDGASFFFRWKIDPSGYVYDAATGDRLEGVKTTAYWIEYQGDDTLWETTPSDDVYGTLWNAAEWDQINPMMTDAQGKYAWDVPEGWWRVKYELEGYETVWSHWMTVPPVQTDVNIGMVFTGEVTPPEYQLAATQTTATSVSVTLTNNTGAQADVQYMLAAYDGEGRMIACNMTGKALATAEQLSLTVDFAVSDQVTEIRAFVLNPTSYAPLTEAWEYTLQ